jgi:hypothetical protein
MSDYREFPTPRHPEKPEPYRLPSSIARGLEENLRSVAAGHFPLYDEKRIIGVFVGVDQFNLLLHIADALGEQRISPAVSNEPSKKEDERYLSFEEVFDS